MADGKKLGTGGLGTVWKKVFSLIKLITGDVDVTNRGDLQTQINAMEEKVEDCFTSASEGKKLVANAVTGKGVSTQASDTFATIAANIAKIKTSPTLQSKSASLSTSVQTIKADTGYDGLSQVSVPAVGGTAGTGDVLSGKTFSSAAGVGVTGTLADQTGTADHSATASLDATNKRLKFKVPAAGKYGTGNYLYAAYSATATLIGLTAAKLVKGNTILGITGSGSNMDTSGADAAAGDVLTGKKAGVKGSLITGTMANRGGTTVDAGAATQDDTYTYLSIPANGYYNTDSKLRTKNSNISNGPTVSATYASGEPNAKGSAGRLDQTVTLNKGQILVVASKYDYVPTVESGNPEITELVGPANRTSTQSEYDNWITLTLYKAVADGTQIHLLGGATTWRGIAAALIV